MSTRVSRLQISVLTEFKPECPMLADLRVRQETGRPFRRPGNYSDGNVLVGWQAQT